MICSWESDIFLCINRIIISCILEKLWTHLILIMAVTLHKPWPNHMTNYFPEQTCFVCAAVSKITSWHCTHSCIRASLVDIIPSSQNSFRASSLSLAPYPFAPMLWILSVLQDLDPVFQKPALLSLPQNDHYFFIVLAFSIFRLTSSFILKKKFYVLCLQLDYRHFEVSDCLFVISDWWNILLSLLENSK